WPLSLDQERFWFMEQLNPSGAGLNIAAATRMRGPVSMPRVAAALDEIVRRHAAWRAGLPPRRGAVSMPRVAAALDEIVRRHAAWRTAFPLVDGGPVQRVAASRRQLLAVVDLSV